MSEYQSDLPVTPKQLQAIGLVAAEWSYLESVMDAAIWTLAGLFSEDIGAAVTTHLAFRPRLDMLATLWDIDCDARVQAGRFSPDEADRERHLFSDIRRRLDSLAAKRNEVVHARWVTGDRGSPLMYVVKARGVLARSKRGMPESEIRDLARSISDCSAELRLLLRVPEDEERQ